jgi:rubrerythrin
MTEKETDKTDKTEKPKPWRCKACSFPATAQLKVCPACSNPAGFVKREDPPPGGVP